jgi:predicted DNA binding CopG/RHH family protein
MKSKRKEKKPIPDFKSEVEEQEFWATHSALDYEMELVEAEVKVDPMARTRSISLRLPERLIADLKEIAHDEGLPYQTLIKLCLQKFVEVRKARAQRQTSSGTR